MKPVVLGLLALAASFNSAAAAPLGEVRVRVAGEVTLNLTNNGPLSFTNVSKGSEVLLTFRVQTPGTVLQPLQETSYALSTADIRVQFPGVGNLPFGGVDTFLVENELGGEDGIDLTPDAFGAYYRIEADISMPGLWDTPDLESLAGTYGVGSATFNAGLIDGNNSLLLVGWHTLTIEAPLAGSTFCDPNEPNTTEFSTLLWGTSTAPAGGLHLEGTFGPPQQFGYFLVGAVQNDPGTLVSNGRLCLSTTGGNTLGRYLGPGLHSVGRFSSHGVLQNLSGTSSTGTGFDVPATLPLPGMPTIQAGETWHFQLWHREPGGSSNFSNGVSVTF